MGWNLLEGELALWEGGWVPLPEVLTPSEVVSSAETNNLVTGHYHELGSAHLLQLPRCDLHPKELLQATVVVSRHKIKEVLEKNQSLTLK